VKRPAEPVAWLGDPGGVLGEELAAGAGQPSGRAVEHVDCPSLLNKAEVLASRPDREVVGAIVVEVAGGQCGAEPVLELRCGDTKGGGSRGPDPRVQPVDSSVDHIRDGDRGDSIGRVGLQLVPQPFMGLPGGR